MRSDLVLLLSLCALFFLQVSSKRGGGWGRSKPKTNKPPGWYPKQQPARPPAYNPSYNQPSYNQPKPPKYGWNVPNTPNKGYGGKGYGGGYPTKTKYPKQSGKPKIKGRHLAMAAAGGVVLGAMFMSYPRYPYSPGYGYSYYNRYETDEFYFFRRPDPEYNVNNNTHNTPILYTFWNGPGETDARAFYCFIVDTRIVRDRYTCAQSFKNYMKYHRSAVFKLPTEYNNTVKDPRRNMDIGFCCGASALTMSVTTLLVMFATLQLLLRD